MTRKRSAIVLGGSGSVGMALLGELLKDTGFSSVHSVSRRSVRADLSKAGIGGVPLEKLVETLVPEMNFQQLAARVREAAGQVEGELLGFSVLGIGAGTAKLSLEEHRAVDVVLNEAFATALQESGKVRHFLLMTAAGADPAASSGGSGAAGLARYNRVKGEAEEAVRASGVPVLSVFRPAMIIGSKHTPWLLEKALPAFAFVTPMKYRSISVQQIAQAMVAAAHQLAPESATYHYPEMMALIETARR